MTPQQLLDQWKPLTEKLSYKAAKRAHVICPYMDQDDFRQIIRITIIKAAKSFDPTRGVRFITFLYQAIYNEINRAMRVEQEAATAGVFVNQAPVDEEGDSYLEEMAVSNDSGPEGYTLLGDLDAFLKRKLSPTAYSLVQVYLCPPKLVIDQWGRYVEGCRLKGSFCLKEPSLNMYAKLLGLPRLTAVSAQRALEEWRSM